MNDARKLVQSQIINARSTNVLVKFKQAGGLSHRDRAFFATKALFSVGQTVNRNFDLSVFQILKVDDEAQSSVQSVQIYSGKHSSLLWASSVAIYLAPLILLSFTETAGRSQIRSSVLLVAPLCIGYSADNHRTDGKGKKVAADMSAQICQLGKTPLQDVLGKV